MRLEIRARGAIRAALVLTMLAVACGAFAHGADAQPREPAQQDEFVPLDEIPPDEQLPAAPLVMVAYAVAWLVILVYLWSIWRRLGRVEREIAAVSRRIGAGSGGPAPPAPRSGDSQ